VALGTESSGLENNLRKAGATKRWDILQIGSPWNSTITSIDK